MRSTSSPLSGSSAFLGPPPSGLELITALGSPKEGTADHPSPLLSQKNTKGCVMSKRHRTPERGHSSDPHADDLRDWQIIGVVVIATSLLVWGLILALHGGT